MQFAPFRFHFKNLEHFEAVMLQQHVRKTNVSQIDTCAAYQHCKNNTCKNRLLVKKLLIKIIISKSNILKRYKIK